MLRGHATQETFANMKSVVDRLYDSISLPVITAIVNRFISEYSIWKDDFPFLREKLGKLLGRFFDRYEALFNNLEFCDHETYSDDFSFEMLILFIKGIKE